MRVVFRHGDDGRPRGSHPHHVSSVLSMFAVYAESFSKSDARWPVWWWGSSPTPRCPDGWTTVTVKAASLNHHDLWSLRGVGLREEALPMILGCDASGVDEDGNEVVVHAVISDPSGRATRPSTRSGRCSPRSTRARSPSRWRCRAATWCRSRRRCPSRRPPACRRRGSPPTGCCSPAAPPPGDTVLVQGAGGGVATAAIILGRAAGLRVLGHQPRRGEAGAGARARRARRRSSPARGCPSKVDAVMETVGKATWSHSRRGR